MVVEREDPAGRRVVLRGSVRVRITAAAVAAVGLVLVVASVAMVVQLRRSLTAQARGVATARGEVVAQQLEAGPTPGTIEVRAPDEEFVQVLDRAGSVIAVSSNVSSSDPVAVVAPGVDPDELVDEVSFGGLPYVVVGVSASAGRSVLVGRTLEDVREATDAVAKLLLVGAPLLAALVGVLAWFLVGRALRPVESMRQEVDAISARELHRRLADPPGKDEIARLAHTMNEMLDRLDGAQTRQRRFVSDASHELRSPVTSIRQHAEVAIAHPDRTDASRLAKVVLEEGARLQQLVDDLLLLGRLDEGSAPAEGVAVDLDDLILSEAGRLRSSTQLTVETAGVSAGRVRGSPVMLERLVRNLTDNAAHHARSTVALSVATNQNQVILTVADDGPGVPEADRDRVFERFVRIDEARARVGGGSGLGLAIVRDVALAHGGTAEVDEAPLGGARFTVVLPVLPD